MTDIAYSIVDEDSRKMASAPLPWNKLEGKTVLISGANGYVPAYFVHAFMARNRLFHSRINVVALCRSQKRAEERFARYLGCADFMLLIQDVRDPVRYEGRVDFIIHAASPASTSNRHINCAETYTANVLGCHNLLEVSRRNTGCRFLLISSVDVYGNTGSTERFSEDSLGVLDGLQPRNAYAMGKRGAETLSACYHAHYGVPTVIARPYQIMGPGIGLNDGRLHIDFISQMLTNEKIVLKSDGSAKRSFLYITDAIWGMLLILLSGTPGQAYNVVDEGGEASVLELATLMASLCPNRSINIEFDMSQRDTPAVTQAPIASLGASQKLRGLSWVPEYTLEKAAARMMKAYDV